MENRDLENHPGDNGHADKGRVDNGRVDNGRVDNGRVDKGCVDKGCVQSGCLENGCLENGRGDRTVGRRHVSSLRALPFLLPRSSLLLLHLLLWSCASDPPETALVDVTPVSGVEGEALRLRLSGRFFFADVVVDYGDPDRTLVTRSMQVFLGDVELAPLQWVEEGGVEAPVPGTLHVGRHDLTIIDAQGRRTIAEGAFEVIEACVAARTCDVETGVPPLDLQVGDCSSPCGASDDCDGLASIRDPEPSTCNVLEYEASFAHPSSSGMLDPGWARLAGSWMMDDGWLRHDGNDSIAVVARTGDVDLSIADYVVEARLRLEEIMDENSWEVSVVARYDHADSRYVTCGMFVDVQADVPRAELFVEFRRNRGDVSTGDFARRSWVRFWPTDDIPDYSPPDFPADDGVLYYLQARVHGRTVGCDLSTETAHVRGLEISAGDPAEWGDLFPDEPGTVAFRTWNRNVAIDYVRIYR